jgi:hypothetical protein
MLLGFDPTRLSILELKPSQIVKRRVGRHEDRGVPHASLAPYRRYRRLFMRGLRDKELGAVAQASAQPPAVGIGIA